MSKKIPSILFILVCLLLVLALPVGMLLFGPGPALANEHRSPRPRFISDGKLNPDFLSALPDYVAERFFLRRELITARNRLMSLTGFPAMEDVVVGEDGWLFFTPTLNDYTGASPMTESELAAAARNLALMREYCEDRGARFLFAVAPNKNSLYGGHMPAGEHGVPLAEHNALRLYALLDGLDVPYADLFSSLGGQAEELYFAHDTHWNSRGAALGADVINAAFGRESAYFSGAFPGSVPHDGDLFEMLYPAAADPETDPVYGGALSYTRRSGTRPDAITIDTASEGGSGSLLAFRDSFGILLYPYLADSFASARFSRAAAYDLTLIDELGADCVLVELVERNLDYLLQNVPVMPAPAREPLFPEAMAPEPVELDAPDAAAAPEGCVLLRGTLPEGTAGAPVYLLCSGTPYEAFALADGGFAACVPAWAVPEGVIYTVNGTPVLRGVSEYTEHKQRG